ncbi:hypothetical protein BDV18DRAFT_144072 [Aspergillus unguis]
MSLQSPLRTFRSSLRSPFSPIVPHIPHRYASINSAIGRGIRSSQRLEDGERSFNHRRDRTERSSFRDRSDRGGRGGRGDFEAGNSARGGNFRGAPREYQQSEYSPRARADRPAAASKNYSRSNDTSRSRDQRRVDRQRPPPNEIDEDEFIRTGNLRALPAEHQQHFEVAEDRKAFSKGRSYTRPQRPDDNRDFPTDRGFKNGQRSRDNEDSYAAIKHRSARDDARPRFNSTPDFETEELPSTVKTKKKHHKATRVSPERVKEHVTVPRDIPYTTPASEFIYGASAVEAALRCSKRQLYKLYLYQGVGETQLSETKIKLRKLALSKSIQVKLAFAEWDRLLDKMSGSRPHNGCVLEASPLPQTPIQALRPVQLEDDHFRVELAPQSREEASVNGTNDQITINRSEIQQHKRYPVVLLLDGVVDPGNLGAIIRSSYYLGVDAIVFAGRNSAPLSPVTIKASAGASENMTLLDVKNEVDFIQRSQVNGWRFYAADALSPDATYIDPASLHARNPAASAEQGETAENASEPVGSIGNSPSVIMMGNEGSGLSRHIRSHADAVVSIPGARHLPGSTDPARVDSLNVSTAAALLMDSFLRIPLGVSPGPRKKGERIW